MSKSRILVLILVTGLILNTSGCLYEEQYWRGWVKRPVFVSVIDKSSNQPIPAAMVELIPSTDLEKRAKGQGLKYTAVSNNDGLAELTVEFPAGGKHYILLFHRIKEKGSFDLNGELRMAADGYRHFEESLVSLTGQRSLPTKNKLPIRITAHLEKQN